MKQFSLLGFLLFVTFPALADSIMIFGNTLQPDGSITSSALVPGVDILLITQRDPTKGLALMGFGELFVNAPATSVLTYTLTLSNLSSPMVVNLGTGPACPGRCAIGADFYVPITYTPVSGSLTVHLNNEIETFNFHYISNVPEPSTLFLLGTGLVGIGWWKYRSVSASDLRG